MSTNAPLNFLGQATIRAGLANDKEKPIGISQFRMSIHVSTRGATVPGLRIGATDHRTLWVQCAMDRQQHLQSSHSRSWQWPFGDQAQWLFLGAQGRGWSQGKRLRPSCLMRTDIASDIFTSLRDGNRPHRMEGDNTSTESRKEARAACALGAKGVSMKGSVRHSVHIVGPRTAPPQRG